VGDFLFNLDIASLIVSLPAIIIALSFHEYAHARMADYLGDPTPAYQGRLTLNPFAHLDPIGFLLLLVARFGWAKPVQVNPLHFRGDRRRGMMLVALAGPAMNIFLAFITALILDFWIPEGLPASYTQLAGVELLQPVLAYNVYLAVFNLIPIPPLDGSKVLAGIVPAGYADYIYRLEAYGPFLLMLLIFTGTTWRVIGGLANGLFTAIDFVSGAITLTVFRLIFGG
jgi:Zn-dependent protease